MLISHRGNINGRVPEKENAVDYLFQAISKEYTVEVDLWWTPQGFSLGHDGPQNPITDGLLKTMESVAWFHVRNVKTTLKLLELCEQPMFFYHDAAPFTFTSNGYLWCHSDSPILTRRSILVNPGELICHKHEIAGVCADNISIYK